jgi:hypothetical protein
VSQFSDLSIGDFLSGHIVPNGKTVSKLCPIENFLSADGAVPTSSAGIVSNPGLSSVSE